METYLKPTEFIDSDSEVVIHFSNYYCQGRSSEIEKAVALYYAVRDSIRYNPYQFSINPDHLKASYVISKGTSFCVPKAILLAASARVQGIHSRLGFADVKNHLASEELIKIMKTNIFVYHGYTELFINQKWVKATAVFDINLCQRFNIKPLEFDGSKDAIFHQYDQEGNKHMEYLQDHGTYDDLPYAQFVESIKTTYPMFFKTHLDVQELKKQDSVFNEEE